ncbi:MAG: hypothetical protein KME20_14660 [Kaiparowitsia implicata GSE-PSE-MK54-09C]|nr:hypothetical protein [Kaiparowitsia implicata GSE-PSE-MK54-09C]
MSSHLISWFRSAMVIALGLAIALFISFENGAIASPLIGSNFLPLVAQAENSFDSDKAADSAERASEQIYEGLDQTKQEIGKTEGRKAVIQKARDHASDKWQSLAEKARTARDSDAELSPVDQHTLKHLTESEP